MFFRALILTVISNFLRESLPVSSLAVGHTRLRLEPQDVIIERRRASKCKNLCLTPGCIASANSVLQNMDPSVDPCDDFYKFACGKFLNETVIPETKSKVSSFSAINDDLQNQLKMIVTEADSDDDIRPFKMVKQFYKSCMDKNHIEEVGLKPVKTVLKNLGGWPVLEENWDEESFDWKQSVYKLRQEGFPINYILDLTINADLKNSTNRRINIDQAKLGLNSKYLVKGMDDRIVEAYYRYMVNIAVAFGADRELATEELRESLEFEIKLAQISDPVEERRNSSKLYNPMTISQVERKFPSIPWLEYINTILAPTIEVGVDEVLINNAPNYTIKLEDLLSTTPGRTQANYMMWRAVLSSISYLSEDVRKYQLQFEAELTGSTERESRWKECVDAAAESLPTAVGSLYVRRFFKEDAKSNMVDMVNVIRKEMYKILKSVDWMDEKTRKNALDKAQSMFSHIAYPDELLDDTNIEEFYAKAEILENDYFGSILSLTKFAYNNSFSKLYQPINKTDWTTHSAAAVVNAFYDPLENSIQFPAGILQGIFFSNDRPHYMNFGAIGIVIGHEITHAFDDQGSQYDKNGNLVEWWNPKTKERYLEKAKCIIDQYGNYTAESVGMKLNGINTQGENIADNGGVSEAYYAYQTWAKNNGPEPRLPGLQNYSPQQMFWLSAANVWCTKYRPEALKIQITTDEHSPAPFRVIGPLSNHKEFAYDFHCPLGSEMNPKKKCKVW